MRILFVCKYNRFRSKVAEAIFNSLNTNKKIKAESAGFTAIDNRPVESKIIEILTKKGYKIQKSLPKQITKNLLEKNKFDLIVIAADNVPIEFFKLETKSKIIQWQVKDCPIEDISCVKHTINHIEKNIKKLVKELKTKKS